MIKYIKLLENLDSYFKTLYETGEISPTETENFLQNYLDFIFRQYNLDYSFFNITIHRVSRMMENALAYMQPDANNPLKFDVYLNKNKYKIENVRSINQFKQNLIKRKFEKNSKYDKKTTKSLVNNYITDENNYLQLVKIITLITDCGHEIHHILQYLKKYSKANKNNKTEYLDDGYELDLKVYNSLTDRELKNYYKILDMISEIELTADSHSYEYFYNLLDALSYLNPGDISYNQFLNTCLQISEEERIERKTQNKYAFKELKTLKKRVKNKYGLDLI